LKTSLAHDASNEALGWRSAQQPNDEIAFVQAGGMVFGLFLRLRQL
jgi:hypothetical protein